MKTITVDVAQFAKMNAEIVMLRACIRQLCPEVEARKLLSFEAAEAIFSNHPLPPEEGR